MRNVKLANILLESTPQFYQTPMLYYVADEPVLPADEPGAWRMPGRGTCDFTTFFNGLSVAKWKKYTVAQEFWLHLEVKGAAFELEQRRGDSLTWFPEVVDGALMQVEASDQWHQLDVQLSCGPTDVVVGFAIQAQGEVCIRNSYYYTQVDEQQVRHVELALCTTTFKKESYILKNIKLVEDKILGSDELVAGNFTMHVIDNGRTLDAPALTHGRVQVHPNPNAGGAGGFTRGMIEAMEQEPKATHVLLMDDDVSISAESIIRTYVLLSLVNDEYAEAFVSGAMMKMNEPDVRHEDIGYVASMGVYMPAKPWARMGVFHDMVLNEAWTFPKEGNDDVREQSYAAWWYCAIPLSVIEREGLPLPVFVRSDDVEYSLRCHAKLMTMNGICIWHDAFDLRYSAAVERYQMPRNVLIGQFTTGMAPRSDFIYSMQQALQLELKKFNYTNAELILDGFEDFLKGPGFIAQKGMAEKSYLASLKRQEKLVPFDELREMMQQLGLDLDSYSFFDITETGERTKVQAMLDLATYNGQRFASDDYYDPDGVAVIDFVGWAYPAGRLNRKGVIVAIDMPNHKGVMRVVDKQRFRQIDTRWKKDLEFFKSNEQRLHEEYAAARPLLTSVEYWKDYLGITEPEQQAE